MSRDRAETPTQRYQRHQKPGGRRLHGRCRDPRPDGAALRADGQHRDGVRPRRGARRPRRIAAAPRRHRDRPGRAGRCGIRRPHPEADAALPVQPQPGQGQASGPWVHQVRGRQEGLRGPAAAPSRPGRGGHGRRCRGGWRRVSARRLQAQGAHPQPGPPSRRQSAGHPQCQAHGGQGRPAQGLLRGDRAAPVPARRGHGPAQVGARRRAQGRGDHRAGPVAPDQGEPHMAHEGQGRAGAGRDGAARAGIHPRRQDRPGHRCCGHRRWRRRGPQGRVEEINHI